MMTPFFLCKTQSYCMALYILGVCWHENAFIFSSFCKRKVINCSMMKTVFFCHYHCFCSFKRQIPVHYMLFMFYCFFLLPGALAILSLNQNLFFKTSIVILLVSYTTFMSYHFQVLLAALSQQVQGTL